MQKCQVVSCRLLVYATEVRAGAATKAYGQARFLVGPRRYNSKLELRVLTPNLVPWVYTHCGAAPGRRLVSAVIDNKVKWLGSTRSERVPKDRQKREKVSWKMGKLICGV